MVQPIIADLLDEVYKWLKKEGIQVLKSSLHEFLKEKVPQWLKLIEDTITNGLPWGLERLKELKAAIIQQCLAYQSSMKPMIKEGTKSLGKVVVEIATKETGKAVANNATKQVTTEVTKQVVITAAKKGSKAIAKKGSKAIAKKGSKAIAKKGAKAIAKKGSKAIAKKGSKAVAKKGSKIIAKETVTVVTKETTIIAAQQGLKAALKSAATPVGIAADLAQAGLEFAGYEKAGKVVGASGNVASGAMIGFAVGGPVGAGVGAAAGYGLWFVGEAAGNLFSGAIDKYLGSSTAEEEQKKHE